MRFDRPRKISSALTRQLSAMRSNNHRNHHRRNRGNKGQDDDQLIVSRVDDSRPESYSRPSHTSQHVEGYRAPSTSNRHSYDMNKEASSSRGHRAESWRHADSAQDSRYNYSSNDAYYRGGREDFDVPESRDSDAWSSRPSDTRYSQPRDEWPQRSHERGYPSSSYPDDTSWHAPSSSSYDHNKSSYDRWSPGETRSHSLDRRSHDRAASHQSDRLVDQGAPGWSRDHRHEKHDEHGGNKSGSQGDGQKWRGQSGWDSRRRDSRAENEPRWNENPSDKNTDDRTWEPAPNWQSSNRGDSQSQRNQNGQRNNNRTSKGTKRSQNNNHTGNNNWNHNRRDWRNDDAALNKYALHIVLLVAHIDVGTSSWSRRDSHDSHDRSTIPDVRKHLRSPSPRSRSRSPSESYSSRRSSRGRTRSPSPSPAFKRQRRDSSPVAVRTPTDKKHVHRLSQTFSGSPESRRSDRVVRRRSVSSVSSMSTDRSRSRTPPPSNPRLVHRLPPFATTSAVPIPQTPLAVPLVPDSPQNGKTNKACFNRNVS